MAARKSSSQDGGAGCLVLVELDAVLLLLLLLPAVLLLLPAVLLLLPAVLLLLPAVLLLLPAVLLLLKLSGPQTVSTVVPRFQFSRGRRLRGF